MDGTQALKMIEEEIPNLLILDLLLPKIDGFDVCRRIRTALLRWRPTARNYASQRNPFVYANYTFI